MKHPKIKHFLIFTALISNFIFHNLVLAETTSLGSGYSCVDGSIRKNGKTITLAKAKSAITNAINQLGNSKNDKAKKTSLKATKQGLKTCAGGSSGGTTGEALTTLLSGRFLNFTGQYSLSQNAIKSTSKF